MDANDLSREVTTFKMDLQTQNMFQSGLLSMLAYDILLTFGEEVDKIWNRPWTTISVLFTLNRYLTPLGFMISMVAYQSEWPVEVCQRFVKYEGAGCATVMGICQVIMILRVNALYGGNRLILLALLVVFLAQIGIQAAVLAEGIPLQEPIRTGCILVARSSIYTGLWIGPLVTDSLIFLLTVWRSRQYLKRGRSKSMPTLLLFLRDGVAYFFVIFSANLLNVVVYFSVQDQSLKHLFGPFSELMTSIMVSHIVLNLRGYHSPGTEKSGDSSVSAQCDDPLAFADPMDATFLYSSQRSAGAGHLVADSSRSGHDIFNNGKHTILGGGG